MEFARRRKPVQRFRLFDVHYCSFCSAKRVSHDRFEKERGERRTLINCGDRTNPSAMPTMKKIVTKDMMQAWNLMLLKHVLSTVSIGIRIRMPKMIKTPCRGLIMSWPVVTFVDTLAPLVELPISGICDVGFV